MPDFMMEVTKENRRKQKELAELKVLCCCPSRYNMSPAPPGDRDHVKAVDKRARVLTTEYRNKAKKVDMDFGGSVEGEVGRVERKLEDYGQVRGLVFGAFGEASEGVHELVQDLAVSRLQAVGLQQGRVSDKGEMAVLVGQIRRILSTTAVMAQVDCLIRRVGSVGPGGAAACKHRKQAI